MGYCFISKNNFLTNLITFSLGAIISQIIVVISSPILTRIYSPEQFGQYGAILSIGIILSTIGTLKYELGIVLPKKEENAYSLFILALASLSVVTVIVVLIGLFFFLFSGIMGWNLSSQQYFFFIPLFLICAGIFNSLIYLNTRFKTYKLLAYSYIVKSSVLVLSQYLFGLLNFKTMGLFAGQILSQFIAISTIVIYKINKRTAIKYYLIKKVLKERKLIWDNAVKYKNFPVYTAPQSLLNATSSNMPTILLSVLFNPIIAGSYWFCFRILIMPINLMNQSFRKVYYQEAAEKNHTELNLFLYKSTLYLGIISIVPCILVHLFGEKIFIIIFGHDWLIAGTYAEWVVLWMFFVFINSPAVMTLHILKKQKILFINDIFLLIFRLISLLVGVIYMDHLFSIKLLTFTGVIFNTNLILYTFYSVKKLK